jgi:hypothetical protein
MNRVYIEPTEFTNTRTGSISHGYRIYDDSGSSYVNGWESIPDDDMELLALVMEEGNEFTDEMLSYVQEHGKSLYIGNEEYQWDEIKHLWDRECQRCGAEIQVSGLCEDETCPFNSHRQYCPVGWIGHGEHAEVNEDTPCTCDSPDFDGLII